MLQQFIKYSLILFVCLIQAQEENNKYTAKGNDYYNNKEYAKAEANYRKESAINPLNNISTYNLGNTIYTQKQYAEAISAYKRVTETSKDKAELHKSFHNLGNVFMQQKKYTEAVAAYKNALRNNPKDEETRYNLALAKQLLKDNPPPQKNENKEDKEQQKDDKNKEQDNQDKKDENKKDQDNKEDKSDNSDSDKDQKDKDKQQQKPEEKKGNQEGKFSKQRMESLLEAINNEEKKIQKKMNKEKVKGQPIQQEKNW
ncbi:MAG: tetratricopeptide repeat protein [Flavobacteriales bacterium]|nr:tetratricopeptide repeat protein [Flavobacteriales bacterium]